MKLFLIVIITFISVNLLAQWPGAFYTFELKGTDGKIVDSLSTGYKMRIDSKTSNGPIGIDNCPDNKLWRFYKGDKNLYVSNSLMIEKVSDGNVEDKMIIKFPPPLTGGEHQYYSNLFIGTIKYKSGTYKVKLPKTKEDWDSLKEIELCPQSYNYNIKYLDISRYQDH